MKKFISLLLIFLITRTAFGAEVKWTAISELTAINDADILVVVDDVAGTPISKKITVLNFFDTIDSSSKLRAIVTDETGTGVLVFGTAPTFTTSITITGANADPAAAGEIRYDNTITGIMSGGALRWFDDNSVRLLVDLETDPSNDDYVVAYDSTADGFYMKADADTGGSTKWNAIGDADGVGSIDFVTYTQTIDIGITDTGGPKDGLIITATGLGAGTTDVRVLKITTTANDDTDYVPITIYDDSGGTPDLLFSIDSTGTVQTGIWDAGAITSSGTVEGSAITEGGKAVLLADGSRDLAGAWNMASQVTTNVNIDSGTIDHEAGGLEADVSGYSGLLAVSGGATSEVDTFAEIDTQISDKSLVNLEDGGTFTGNVIANANLSVGNATTTAGVLTILEDDDDGTNFASFTVPAIATNTVYTLPPDDGDNTEVLQTDGSGVLTWVANAGGNTKWNDIGDADAPGSVDFDTHTQTIDIGVTDTGGPKDGLILTATGLGAGTTDINVLKITTTANNDTDYIPLLIQDDSGGTPDTLFLIDSEGNLVMTFGGEIRQSVNNSLTFTDNGDTIVMGFDGTNLAMEWSDGDFILRNTDVTSGSALMIQDETAGQNVNVEIYSAGNDKYIEAYHDDTDGYVSTSSGDLYLVAAGGDIQLGDENIVTTGTLATGTITTASNIKSEPKHMIFNIINPLATQTEDNEICLWPAVPAALTVTKIEVTLDASGNEVAGDFKWADAFIGLANATVINVFDTTSGVLVDSTITAGSVASGKCLYLAFDSAPDTAIKQMSVDITFDYD